MPTAVEPGVWVSGAEGVGLTEDSNITHIVSVINGPPPTLPSPSLQHLHIDIEDVPEANLLQRLPSTLDFMAAALAAGGGVLVHCAQGVSRSAAVTTAHLMRSRGLGYDQALAVLRESHPAAAPNEGFAAQLRLFHEMGCRLDPGGGRYTRFLLEQAGRHHDETGCVDAEALSRPEDSAAAEVTVYRCRKCRCLVATAHNVVDTEEGAGEEAFAWRKRDKLRWQGAAPAAAEEAGGLFVEPLGWMAEAVGAATQGKLYCPKCQARLGSFNWAGSQSSSGTWVTPAFNLHLSRIDTIHPGAGLTPAAVRQPRVLPRAAAPTPAQQRQQQEQEARRAAAAAAKDAAVAAPLPAGGFTHLILDCDGVLVDSERASCGALHRSILEVTGVEIAHDFPADFVPVFGMDVRSCLEHYRATMGAAGGGFGEGAEELEALATQVANTKEGIYKEMTSGPAGIPAFPGARALVAAARRLGWGVAVASSGSPAKIQHNLSTSGLVDLFEAQLVVSAAYVARGKPAPDVYFEALRRAGCGHASRAVVVEDAVNGLKAARAAGCFAVGVATSLPAAALAPHADLVVESLEELDLDALAAGSFPPGCSWQFT